MGITSSSRYLVTPLIEICGDWEGWSVLVEVDFGFPSQGESEGI